MAVSPLSETTEHTATGICATCRRAVTRTQVYGPGGNVLNEIVTHNNSGEWTDRICEAVFVLPSPVVLDDARLAEIGDLIRYESSVSFHSHRARESIEAMNTALKAVRALHHVISVPASPDDFMEICAGCGEEGDGPCSTLRALGQSAPSG